jgi:ABC-type Mn2+/Zn2+ transport system ATPase subunit
MEKISNRRKNMAFFAVQHDPAQNKNFIDKVFIINHLRSVLGRPATLIYELVPTLKL